MNHYRKPLTSLLIKPAGPDCNLGCEYCFYLEKEELFSETKVHRMSEAVLEEMIRQALEQASDNFSFGWQGGEPTLMGLPFYEKAVEFQQKYGRGQVVGNGLQTNGILIDQKWAEFLKKYNFLVGLSLDGPEFIHDHYRRLKGGQPSWQKVIDSANLMLQNDVAVNALSVVNDYSVNFPEEIYNFHKQLGLSFMQFIPCVETNNNDKSTAAPFSVSAQKYGEFICKMFDLWYNDFKDGSPTTSVRYFDSVFYSYVGMKPPECTLHTSCGIYLVVEHTGDVYSCDFFVEPDWKLGNVMQDRLIDLLNSEKQNDFGLLKADFPQDCLECQWLKHCYGGCTKDRIKDPRDRGLDHFCVSHKMFFEHADSRLRQLADDWQDQQMKETKQQTQVQSVPQSSKKVGRNDPCPCGSGLKYKKCCGNV